MLSPSPFSPSSSPSLPFFGFQGYLKFSINVIGPGDEPKASPSTLTQESVDIESYVHNTKSAEHSPNSITVSH